MQIWRNLELKSVAHLLVAASRSYRSPMTGHSAAVPLHDDAMASSRRGISPQAVAAPATSRAGDGPFARDLCPDWLRLIADNRNG